jgi:uncharacterized protein YigE (DUF2233 family)
MNWTFLSLLLAPHCLLQPAAKPSVEPIAAITWREVDKGLQLGEYVSPIKSTLGDSKVTLLKISPAEFDFKLVSAKEPGERIRTASDWCGSRKLVAAVNAGMYREDYKTNVGYMKNYGFVNNPTLNKDNTIIAFNRKDASVPPVQIIDLQCQVWDSLKGHYDSFTQGIRMVDCHQQNMWSQQDRKWSMVVMGMDLDGNALFIFTRSPYSVHDFINILLASPLRLKNAMYLEGGPEASLYMNHNGIEVMRCGSYETGFNENDNNHQFWQIPNMIGIVKKAH